MRTATAHMENCCGPDVADLESAVKELELEDPGLADCCKRELRQQAAAAERRHRLQQVDRSTHGVVLERNAVIRDPSIAHMLSETEWTAAADEKPADTSEQGDTGIVLHNTRQQDNAQMLV